MASGVPARGAARAARDAGQRRGDAARLTRMWDVSQTSGPAVPNRWSPLAAGGACRRGCGMPSPGSPGGKGWRSSGPIAFWVTARPSGERTVSGSSPGCARKRPPGRCSIDAIAVSAAGAGRYAGLAPCGTALTARGLGEDGRPLPALAAPSASSMRIRASRRGVRRDAIHVAPSGLICALPRARRDRYISLTCSCCTGAGCRVVGERRHLLGRNSPALSEGGAATRLREPPGGPSRSPGNRGHSTDTLLGRARNASPPAGCR